MVYHLLKYREAFNPESAAAYTRKRHEQEVKQLTRRAQKLGYTLIPADASPLSQFLTHPVGDVTWTRNRMSISLTGRLEIEHRRDTMIGLCIGMRQPGWYDRMLDRLNQPAMGLD